MVPDPLPYKGPRVIQTCDRILANTTKTLPLVCLGHLLANTLCETKFALREHLPCCLRCQVSRVLFVVTRFVDAWRTSIEPVGSIQYRRMRVPPIMRRFLFYFSGLAVLWKVVAGTVSRPPTWWHLDSCSTSGLRRASDFPGVFYTSMFF